MKSVYYICILNIVIFYMILFIVYYNRFVESKEKKLY